MSARDDILERVRRATATAQPVEHPGPVSGVATTKVTVDLFAERVADYRAVVERCSAAELRDRLLAALAGLTYVVPAGLSVDLPGGRRDDALSAADLDAIDAVVTDATVGIAETGTIVLDHGPGQGRRALSLVPDHHLCIVRADQVVPDVPDAVRRLDPSQAQTWISGPSATSDIELSRVEGVHGPRHLHVLLVDR